MKTFKDSKGRTWEVVINVYVVGIVRSLVKVDLYALIENGAKGLGDLLSDPVKLVEVLCAICREQLKEKNLSDEDFGRAFSGDVLEEATEAFCQELIDFFPNPKARASLRKLIEKSKGAMEIVTKDTDDEIDQIDIASLAERLKTLYGKRRDSLQLTPDP